MDSLLSVRFQAGRNAVRDQGSHSPLWGRRPDRVAEELEETRQEACNEGTVEVKCTALYAMGEVSGIGRRAWRRNICIGFVAMSLTML